MSESVRGNLYLKTGKDMHVAEWEDVTPTQVNDIVTGVREALSQADFKKDWAYFNYSIRFGEETE